MLVALLPYLLLPPPNMEDCVLVINLPGGGSGEEVKEGAQVRQRKRKVKLTLDLILRFFSLCLTWP
jgi:hypothetical protein